MVRKVLHSLHARGQAADRPKSRAESSSPSVSVLEAVHTALALLSADAMWHLAHPQAGKHPTEEGPTALPPLLSVLQRGRGFVLQHAQPLQPHQPVGSCGRRVCRCFRPVPQSAAGPSSPLAQGPGHRGTTQGQRPAAGPVRGTAALPVNQSSCALTECRGSGVSVASTAAATGNTNLVVNVKDALHLSDGVLHRHLGGDCEAALQTE